MKGSSNHETDSEDEKVDLEFCCRSASQQTRLVVKEARDLVCVSHSFSSFPQLSSSSTFTSCRSKKKKKNFL